MKLINCLLIFCFFITGNFVAQDKWELKKEKEGVSVFTKKEIGKDFKTFKAITKVNATVHDFVAVLNDIAIFPTWGDKIEEAKLLERSGDTLQIYYSTAKAPFPYKNRDGIYLNRFKWNKKKQVLFVDIEILSNYLPENEKNIRVGGYGYWEVKEIEKNTIQIIFSMLIDPGGNIPAWLGNMFVEDSPFNSLLNLKKVLEEGDYIKKTYSFIH